MRVLISGSTGLIGTALVEALKITTHTPVRLLREPRSDDTPSVLWDPQAAQLANDALNDIDAIVHLAGEPIANKRWTAAQKERILTSRTKSTELLANAISQTENRPRVFLSGSAIGFYGDRGEEELSEVSSLGEGFLADVVRQWENAAHQAQDLTRLVFLRTGVVLSDRGGALHAQLPFFKLGIGGRIGNGQQWLSWISIQDTVAAIIWLLENDVSGPVNLCSPNPVTNAEFTKTLGRVLGRPTILPTPKLATWAKVGPELAESLLYTSQKIKPTALQSSGFQFTFPELEPALQQILKPQG